MKVKPGVSLGGLQTRVMSGLPIIERVYNRHDLEMVVTSTTDDTPPRPLPAHREGRAVDIRAHQVNPYLLPVIRKEIERELGGHVTVKAVLVYPETAATHIHVEWQ